MKFRLFLIVSLLGLGLLAAGSYFSSKGRVYIDLSNVSADATVTLKIHEKDDNIRTRTIKNKSSVTLNSGTYALSLHSGPNSLITAVTVPSFFGSTTISGGLENEQKRTFVGTNPSPCMLYVANTFYSMACGDDTNALQQQIAPTLSTPGYTVTPEPEVVGVVLGTSATNTATYVLLESYTDEGTIQDLVQVGGGFTEAKVVEIPTFAANDPVLTASGNRVLVYSATERTGYVYDELTGSLKKVTLPEPESDFGLISVSLSSELVVSTYSNAEESDEIEGEIVPGETTIYVQDASGTIVAKHTTSKLYSKAIYCSPGYVCAVGVEGLDSYKQEGTTLKKMTNFPGVNDLFTSGDTVRFIDDIGIVLFDSSSLKGHYEYIVGEYEVCGISAAVGGYMVCVIDTKNQKHALFISTQNKAGKDDVDKKVLDILKSNVVSGVAAVNNYIYVIPDYGDVGIFTQDKETTSRINQAIDSVIRKSTIPKESYFVINAGNPL
ncbi:MAG: hypothetical protein WAS36_01590 [Candidatus Saccharimonadales bacterium]